MAAERKLRLDDVSSNADFETRKNPIQHGNGSCSSNDKFLSDRRHLLNVFPEEVWDQLLKKVQDPKSLECLSNSSLFLRELLAPQRVQFLFPTVLEIMGDNDPVDKNPISWLLQLDISPLKLRSVCQYWNKIIDNMIDNHPFHLYLQDDARIRLNSMQFKFHSLFEKTPPYNTRHSLLLDHFDRTHGNADRNPFLGRSIEIPFVCLRDYEEEEIMADVIPTVRTVLQKYGIHIFHCSFNADDLRLSNSMSYSLIREFLQLMPNLKVFKCFGNSDNRNSSMNEMNELEDRVNKNPLPTIPSLQMLATYDLASPIFQELIRSNRNIFALEISKMWSNLCYDMSTVSLPLLTTFSMTSLREVDIYLLNDSRLNWALTRLFLKIIPNRKIISWKCLFDAVSNFAGTLTHVQLELPPLDEFWGPSVLEHLNIPHVTSLSLVMPAVTCLDFLLPTKNTLQFLDIRINLQHPADELTAVLLMHQAEAGGGQIIKFWSCGNWFESNMWTIFLNLTQIKFALRAQKPGDYSRYKSFREILRWSCNRQEWVKRANLSAL